MTSIPCLHDLHAFTLDTPNVQHAVTHPSGFLTTHFAGATRVWSEGGEAVAVLDVGETLCVAWSPSGDMVASCIDDSIKVWRDSTCVLTCHGHTCSIHALAVSPLDGTIVSGSNDKTAKVWSGTTGECVATLEGHTDFLSAVCVLENGDVVTGSVDQTVRVWERDSWTCTAAHELPTWVSVLEAMPQCGFVIGGAADGFVGFLSAWRGGVELWGVETRSEVSGLAVVGDVVVACTSQQCLVVAEGVIVGRGDACSVKPVALGSGKVALFEGTECSVHRIVRSFRLSAIHILVTAWEAHGGVPPPHTGGFTPRAGDLAGTLSLRRLCRPRGESEIGQATELVEPFGQAVVAFL